jgi:hypothetical protein
MDRRALGLKDSHAGLLSIRNSTSRLMHHIRYEADNFDAIKSIIEQGRSNRRTGKTSHSDD